MGSVTGPGGKPRRRLAGGLALLAAFAAGLAGGASAVLFGARPEAVAAAAVVGAAGAAAAAWLVSRHNESAEPGCAAATDGGASSFEAMYRRLETEYEAIAGELRLALEAQRKWQPPVDMGLGVYRVTARNRQARDIGGDLFDAVVVDDTTIAVLSGDVPGKGLQAALMVPALMILFRSEMKRGGGAADMLERMNRLLAGTGAASGVTMGIGMLDVVSGEMRYAGAGHPAPYLAMAGCPPRQLDSSSLPLGIGADETYAETAFRLAPGERFVLYTDGIVEASDAQGAMYGFDRFEAELAAWPAETAASEWMDKLLRAQDERYAGRQDDRTLLVVERLAPSVRPFVLHERTWSLRAVPGCERAIIHEFGAMIREAWPEAGRTDDMVTCVAEAVMNAAEHGNRFDETKTVSVHVHFGNMLMVCRVRDEGAGFDPAPYRSGETTGAESRREAAARREDGRGWGLLLIESLSDYWMAASDERGFCLELFFLARHRQ